MKSAMHGTSISQDAEVLSIGKFGVWVLAEGKEHLLDYKNFPWFKTATVEQVLHLTLPHPGHLYWPDLDIDLATNSHSDPDAFPLIAKS